MADNDIYDDDLYDDDFYDDDDDLYEDDDYQFSLAEVIEGKGNRYYEDENYKIIIDVDNFENYEEETIWYKDVLVFPASVELTEEHFKYPVASGDLIGSIRFIEGDTSLQDASLRDNDYHRYFMNPEEAAQYIEAGMPKDRIAEYGRDHVTVTGSIENAIDDFLQSNIAINYNSYGEAGYFFDEDIERIGDTIFRTECVYDESGKISSDVFALTVTTSDGNASKYEITPTPFGLVGRDENGKVEKLIDMLKDSGAIRDIEVYRNDVEKGTDNDVEKSDNDTPLSVNDIIDSLKEGINEYLNSADTRFETEYKCLIDSSNVYAITACFSPLEDGKVCIVEWRKDGEEKRFEIKENLLGEAVEISKDDDGKERSLDETMDEIKNDIGEDVIIGDVECDNDDVESDNDPVSTD